MAHLIWSPQAVDDLEAACEYIARDSEAYAADFAHRIVTAVEILATHPKAGRTVPEFGDESLRELIIGHYRVLYDVRHAERVVLLTIHHSARLLHSDPRQSR